MECDLQWACSACPESQWEPLMEGWTSVSAVILPLRSSSLPSSLPYVSPWGYTSAPTGWIALWLSGRQWVFHNWLVSLCAQATRKLSDVITRLPLLTCAHTVWALHPEHQSFPQAPQSLWICQRGEGSPGDNQCSWRAGKTHCGESADGQQQARGKVNGHTESAAWLTSASKLFH